jgi:hypothetical protein
MEQALRCSSGQFGERDQVRNTPMVYAHGSWHEGARVAFFVGTPREFEIDFVYGVRKSHDLEAVPVGVFEAHEDYPGVSSPKKGGGSMWQLPILHSILL